VTNTLLVVVVIAFAAVLALWVRARGGVRRPSDAGAGGSRILSPSEVEDYVRAHVVEIAEDQFPDNVGLQWTVLGFQHREDLGLVFVEVEPRPDEVGYPRFQFALQASHAGPPKRVATYCLDAGHYTLLSTSPGAPRNVPKQIG
jgi:hypothetical protein